MSRNCLKRQRTACFRRAAERSAHCAVISLSVGRKSANTRVSSHVAPVRDSTAICPLVSGRSSSAYAPFSPGRSSTFAASGMNRGGQAAEICSAERTSAQSPAVSRRRTRKSGETASTVPSAQGSREETSGASRASSLPVRGESAARSAGDKAASSWGKILRNYTRTTSDTSSSWCTTRTVSPAAMAGKGFSASK